MVPAAQAAGCRKAVTSCLVIGIVTPDDADIGNIEVVFAERRRLYRHGGHRNNDTVQS
jgi:hypothetical protein